MVIRLLSSDLPNVGLVRFDGSGSFCSSSRSSFCLVSIDQTPPPLRKGIFLLSFDSRLFQTWNSQPSTSALNMQPSFLVSLVVVRLVCLDLPFAVRKGVSQFGFRSLPRVWHPPGAHFQNTNFQTRARTWTQVEWQLAVFSVVLSS